MRNLVTLLIVGILAAPVLSARQSISSDPAYAKNIAGTVVHYDVVLPEGYNAYKEYPAILAFPGGGQTMGLADITLERNWREEAEKLGYIVIIPSAPNGELFFKGGAKIFPEFIVRLLADYKVLGNKFHIAGVSNGGLSAFYIAAMYPQYFWSVTGFPGYLLNATPDRVHALSGMCIFMYAGEQDRGWLEPEEQQAMAFRQQGMKVEFSEEKGQDHAIRTLEGSGAARLFAQFEEARKGCGK